MKLIKLNSVFSGPHVYDSKKRVLNKNVISIAVGSFYYNFVSSNGIYTVNFSKRIYEEVGIGHMNLSDIKRIFLDFERDKL